MVFVPGKSGNPSGRLHEKIAADNLRLAVQDQIRRGKHAGKTKLRRIAERIAEAALQGEPWACSMVFDRLDGKAMQVIDQSITFEAGAVFVELLQRMNEQRHGRTIEHTTSSQPHIDHTTTPQSDQSTSNQAKQMPSKQMPWESHCDVARAAGLQHLPAIVPVKD